MYSKKHKCWISENQGTQYQNECADPENKDLPRKNFYAADKMLEKTDDAENNTKAFLLMKEAAKAGYADAAFAIGQMYFYGWAVGKSKKNAVEWYTYAKKLGSASADAELKSIKRQKTVKTAGIILIVLVAVTTVVLFAFEGKLLSGNEKKIKIKVSPNTELISTSDITVLVDNLQKLKEKYDDALVIKGERSTKRILLRFSGKHLDLTDFPADIVCSDEEELVIIQFNNQKDAQECLQKLQKMKYVEKVTEDEYSNSIDAESVSTAESTGIPYQPYNSQYSGKNYYSWGVAAMQMDRYAAWIMNEGFQDEVVVAVLDSGCKPCADTADRIDPGINFALGGDGTTDFDGHGTHVSGIILDSTQGLNVRVLPLGVVNANGCGNDMDLCIALRYAIDEKVNVINISMGSYPNGNCSSLSDDYIIEAIDAGIVVVVSAGNGDPDTGVAVDAKLHCHSHLKECIVVGALDSQEIIAPFSNYGDVVDVAAPGVDVVSYYIDGAGLKSLDGTSMATPHVSALAAMMCTYMKNKTPAQIESYIKYYCKKVGDTLHYGQGLPQCEGLIGY